MFTRITLMLATGLMTCAITSAQVAVDFRSAVKQTAPSILAIRLDVEPSQRSTVTSQGAIYELEGKALRALKPPAWAQPKKDADPTRSGFAVAEDLVISCQVPQDQVEMVTGDGRTLNGRVVARDHVTGLVAIGVEDAALPGLSVASEVADAGLPVLLSWLKGGKTLTSRASMLASEPNADHFSIGFSQSLGTDFAAEAIGAPIIDPSGTVVGVLGSKDEQTLCLATAHVARLTEAAADDRPKDLYRGRIGIQLDNQQGALVNEVMDQTPAKEAGLAAGDKVTRVGDRQCRTLQEVMAAVSMLRAGDQITVEVQRGDETITKTLELASAGPELETVDPRYIPEMTPRMFRLKDGRLVPIEKDAPVVELDIRSPLRGLRLGNLQVERSELEQSLKKLEAEKQQQDELIKKLQEKIAQMEAKADRQLTPAEGIARLEEILEQIEKKLESQAGQESTDGQDEPAPR